MDGWIKLHRKFFNSSIAESKDCYLIQLWIYILLKVNHKPKKFIWNSKEIIIRAGEGIFGLNQMVKDLTKFRNEKSKNFGRYRTIYYRRLRILNDIGNIETQTTNKFTLIKVINWNKYQQNETQVKLKRNSSETQTKTNKNEKNEKNEKNITKVIEKSEYGNSDINKILKKIKDTFKIPALDESEKINRRYAYLLLQKYKDINLILATIEVAASDSFWHNKITSVKPLYYNFIKLASLTKQNNGIIEI